MAPFFELENKTACYYWITSIILVIFMIYYVFAAIFYLIFIHRHQKMIQKQKLLSNLNCDLSVQHQRFKLWMTGHILHILFLCLACCDMILEISTSSITSDGNTIMNKPGSLLTVSCYVNGCFRFIGYMLSNFVFSLFSWYKCQLVYTSIQPSKSITFFVKAIFYYIIVTYPIFIIWGSFELHHSYWTVANEMRLCYLYFPATLFAFDFAHDLMLYILLLLLFMVPLWYQRKRAKRVQIFGQRRDYKNSYDNVDAYDNFCKVAIITDKASNISMQREVENAFRFSSTPKMVNKDDAVSDELAAAMIRNGIAGSAAAIIAAFFLTSFYFAAQVYLNEERLWSSGFMLAVNMLRYVVLYICMTVTYKDWKAMLFPWTYCCKTHDVHKESNSNMYNEYVIE